MYIPDDERNEKEDKPKIPVVEGSSTSSESGDPIDDFTSDQDFHTGDDSQDSDLSPIEYNMNKPLPQTVVRRYPPRQRKAPAKLDDYVTDDSENFAHAAFHMYADEPRDYNAVKGRKDEADWNKAIEEELRSIEENETWCVVKRPDKVKLIGCRWIFKIKPGETLKYKARLVARGYMQTSNELNDTYSPVARLPTVRLLLAIGVQYGFKFYHLDVKTAFLNGLIDEDIFLKAPDGVQIPDGYVLRLKKSLYGLRQSPKCWNIRFHEYISSLGFKRSSADYCLYVKYTRDKCVYLVLYVDDMLICGNDFRAIDDLKISLNSEFKMNDLGEVSMFMGMNIHHNSSKGILEIDQEDYIERILERFRMKDCNPVLTPMEVGCKLSRKTDEESPTSEPFREALGAVMYLMLASRPDICFAIGYLSRFQDCATDVHWNHLKRVLRYLRGTSKMKLVYKQSDSEPLVGYADADWANDAYDRKSTSGYLFQVFGNTVLWSSKKQGLVTTSTTEAEYVAAASASMEAIWLTKIFADLHVDPKIPVKIYEDNVGCIYVAKNPETKRSKHIDVKFHFLRDRVWRKEIKLVGIESKNQVADVFTKSLAGPIFSRFVDQMGFRREGVLN